MAKGATSLLIAGLGLGTAAGVALGALVLAPNTPGHAGSGDSGIREEHRKLLDDNKALQAQNSSSDEVVNQVAPTIVDGSLAQRPVVVISTGDAKKGDVDAVKELLRSAGAVDAGHIALTDSFLNREKADKLLSIIANTLPAGTKLDPAKRDVGTHAGQAMGAALLMDPETTEPIADVKDRALLLRALRDGGYIEYQNGTILPAQAVVIVSGDGTPGYYAENLRNFAIELNGAGGSTVAAGGEKQAAEDGALGMLRAEKTAGKDSVSTVDSIERGASRLAAVMAIKEQLDGGSGAYGSAPNADAPTPDPHAAGRE